MPKTGKTIIIVTLLVALVLLGAIAFYGYRRSADANAAFPGDGYILRVTDDDAVERVYFTAGGSYRSRYPDGVRFTDVLGDGVDAEATTWLHYTNESVGALCEGVVLDLEALGAQVTPFYRMGTGTVLSRAQDGTYRLNNGNTDIPMGTALYKLSDDTYLIASDKLTLYLSDTVTEEVTGSVELTYMDKNVVRLVTGDKVYYTISPAARIETQTGLSLYPAEKRVRSADGEVLLKLSEMLLDSDAAIEVLPGEDTDWVVPTFHITTVDGEDGDEGVDGEQGLAGTEGETGQDGGEGAGGGEGSSGAGGASGATGATGGTAGSAGDEGVVLPDFLLTAFSVTDMGFTGSVTIGGNYDLLTDNATYNRIYVEELATGRQTLVDSSFRQADDTFSFLGAVDGSVSLSGLKTDTRYRLVVQSAYEVDGVEFERVFLSKEFVTDSMGVMMEYAYATETSGTVRVIKKEYSNAYGAQLSIYRKDAFDPSHLETGVLGTIVLDEQQLLPGGTEVTFSGAADSLGQELAPNTEYVVVLKTTNENGSLVTSQERLVFRTLKTLPVIEAPVVVTDQRNSVFTIEPRVTSNPHDGIVKYSYQIYNALTDQFVKTVTANSANPYTLVIDGSRIERDVFYKARLVADFYDNEKTVELTSAFSNDFIMRGTGYPYATFSYTATYTDDHGLEVELQPAEKSSFSRVNGMLYINFNGAQVRIADDYTSGVDALKVTITSLEDYSETRLYYLNSDDLDLNNDQYNNGFLEIPIERNGLKADASYLISVRGTVDLGDGTGYSQDFLIGNCVFTTANVPALQAMWSTPTNANSALAVGFHLEAADGVSEADAALAASTLTQMTFDLYVGTPSSSNPPLRSIRYPDQDDSPFVSTIGNETYGASQTGVDNVLLITERFFGMETSQLPSNATGFTVVASNAIDYSSTMATPVGITPTNYTNTIPIKNNSTYIHKSNTPPAIPDLDAMTVIPIYNFNATDFGIRQDPSLENGTVVGFQLIANFSNEQRLTRSINFYVYENTQYALWKTQAGLRPGVDTGAEADSGYIAQTTVEGITDTSLTTSYAVVVLAGAEYATGFTVPSNYITLGDYTPDATVYGAYDEDPEDDEDLAWGRGWTYYFAYDAGISLTNTETVNHTFPYDNAEYDGTTILGKRQNAAYQKPVLSCYPYTSANTNSTWAYYLTDVDGTLPATSNFRVQRTDTTPLVETLSTQSSTQTAEFLTVVIPAPVGTVVSTELLYWELIYDRLSGAAGQKIMKAFSYKQEALHTLSASGIGVTIDNLLATDNMIRIGLSGAQTVLSNIPALYIEAEEANGGASAQFCVSLTERDYVGVSSTASGIVLASDLGSLSGSVTMKVYALYDTGVSGFHFSAAGRYAIAVANADITGVYMIPNVGATRLVSTTSGANDSLYTVSGFTPTSNGLSTRLTVTPPLAGSAMSLLMGLTPQGVRDPENSSQLLTLKKLGMVQIGSASGTSFTITTAVPVVSMSPAQDIVASLNNATFRYKIEGTRAGTIKDSRLNLSLYKKVDPTSTYSEYEELTEARQSVTLTYSDATAYETEFAGLSLGTDYYVRYWVEIATDDAANPWREVTLLQKQDYTRKAEYYFTTVDNVAITNATGQFSIIDYEHKQLLIGFSLSEVLGFDIEFELFEQADNGQGQTDYALLADYDQLLAADMLPQPYQKGYPGQLYNTQMEGFPVELAAGSLIEPGKSYRIDIIAMSTALNSEGQREELGRGYLYITRPPAVQPLISVLSEPRYTAATEGGDPARHGISYTVMPSDVQKVVVGGEYLMLLLDEDGVSIPLPEAAAGAHSITQALTFTVDGLQQGTGYTLHFFGVTDMANSGVDNAGDPLTAVSGLSTEQLTPLLENGQPNPLLLASKTQKTLGANGIEIGTLSVSAQPGLSQYLRILFTGAYGIASSAEVQGPIVRAEYMIATADLTYSRTVNDTAPTITALSSNSTSFVYNLTPQLDATLGKTYYVTIRLYTAESGAQPAYTVTLQYNT